jgi:T5SS/PEP-CTERM-associated repeat protein
MSTPTGTTYIWTGNDNNSNFSDPQNWDPTTSSQGPGVGDDALIDDGTGAPVGSPVSITQTTEVANLTIDYGALDDNGSALTVDDEFVVGATSPNNSLVTAEDGGSIDAGSVDIGQGDGTFGSVTLDASSGPATLNSGSSIIVGDGGTGYLYLYNGATVAAGTSITIGNAAGSSGFVSLSNDSQLTANALTLVGDDGGGSLSIESGSIVDIGPLGPVSPGDGVDLGVGGGDGSGSVTVDGNGSQLNVSRQIYVGGPNSSGGNSLTISNGAVVDANLSGDAQTENIDAFAIAFEADQIGGVDEVTITGAGSELNANGTIVVGVNGTVYAYVEDGGELVGNSYPTGVSGIAQASGSTGYLYIQDGSTYSDGDLKVGDAGRGYLYVTTDSSATLGNDLVLGAQANSYGFVEIGDAESQSLGTPDTSSLTVGAVNVGGDFGGPGGDGFFSVQADAQVNIASYLGIWGSATNEGTLDLYNLSGGYIAVGAFPEEENGSDFAGDLVLNPGGQVNLDNGIIQGGELYLNGGSLTVTPVGDQVDDDHSLLTDVTIAGEDLKITNAVLTLGNTTHSVNADNVLIDATGSLVDLSELGNVSNESYLDQTINATDLSLTVADPFFVIASDETGLGQVDGTGAVFSDYSTSAGFFSGDVALENHGLIDAQDNDASVNPDSVTQGQLSLLTNSITNEPDGTFEADNGATLNIGNAQVLLDDEHVFTNLHDNGNGTSSLVDGFYDANGGDIDINGTVNPISTLEAVLYLTGVNGVAGDLSVNDTSILQTLTTITPSGNGEGDLAINSATVTFSNPIEIQGLQSGEPTSWSFNAGYSGGGGGLYLDNGTFSGPGLTIDAATTGGEAAFIFGNGVIDAPVTMNGTATVYDYGDSESINSLEFADAVTGSGIYTINGGDVLTFNSTLGVMSDPITENTINFAGANSSLQVGAADVTDDFRATITDFAKGDTITLLNVEATSAQFDSVSDQLDVFNGNAEVATLQLDNTIPADQLFNVIPHGVDGSTIEFAPACFCGGTLIRTEYGEVAVETLAIGDRVMTASGELRRVEWIGRRKIAARFVDPLTVWPVRITAGALAEGMPSRDLLVSPDHAILVDDVLIQAGALVNGNSIIHETRVAETFSYYHIELTDHSLIFAENTPAETFVDNIDRLGFDNWAEHEALFPNGNAIGEMPYPRAKAHRQVPRSISHRLSARAAALVDRGDVAA